MSQKLDLRGLLDDLARSDCRCIVIGSSGLAVQEWEVHSEDLDLFVRPDDIEDVRGAIGALDESVRWVQDGEARRLECLTDKGPVDLYVAVSGDLDYDAVMEGATEVFLGDGDLSIMVSSARHIRDMRSSVGRVPIAEIAVAPGGRPGVPQVIAIDGPAGAGKSTTSRMVAQALGFTYLETGAMYRCVALAVRERRADLDDPDAIERIAGEIDIEFRDGSVLLDGHDVSREIRSGEIAKATSHISAFPEVRQAMLRRQRTLFERGRHVVEGRDTGTVVAPDAPLKIFLTASLRERAIRRSQESGEPPEVVEAELGDRDRLDTERRFSALRMAVDAVRIDTSGRSAADVVEEIASLAREREIV